MLCQLVGFGSVERANVKFTKSVYYYEVIVEKWIANHQKVASYYNEASIGGI